MIVSIIISIIINKWETVKLESSYYFWQDKIKKTGLRLTGTRKTILETILKNPGEYDAEEIQRMVGGKAAIATIYRTLNLLKDLGVIINSSVENNKVKYRLKNTPKRDTGTAKGDSIHGYISSSGSRKYENMFPKENGIEQKFMGINTGSDGPVPVNPDGITGIRKMEARMSAWLKDLNNLKREKEMELEDIVKDLAGIDGILEKHAYEKSNLIQILLDVQEKYNWLPKHVLHYLGTRMDIPLTGIYSIASFYKSFSLEPRGKHSIVVCLGTACHVRGAMNLLQRIVNVLGIKPGDTTGDYKFTLDTVNCLGCCALGPVMMLDNKYYSNPSSVELKKMLSSLD
ncbi:MAG: NAD(P)H-dependent oxidoreductase subunit E [Actinobacteria bacterium]|nr:NAD(P)H-dependent oxidoreductase subunit E [Actinomycetota bacterium]